jgi:hypothetical protein
MLEKLLLSIRSGLVIMSANKIWGKKGYQKAEAQAFDFWLCKINMYDMKRTKKQIKDKLNYS